MSANNPSLPLAVPRGQDGAATVEFAMLAIVFLAFIFGIVELARAMYLYNTLQEVTRRAAKEAASTNFKDGDALKRLRYLSVMRDTPGTLPLGTPVTDEYVRIDYLALVRNSDGSLKMEKIAAGALPADPAANRMTCLTNPHAASCIRFVQVQICDPAVTATCARIQYQMLFPLIQLPLPLPRATTIATAESLGFIPGQVPGS
jgi:hypothetical protein